VSQQTPVVTLVPPALELVVNVEESQLGQVAEGQSVQLEVPAYPGTTFTGTVRAIAPTIDARSRTAAVRVEPKDDASKLRAGMFARLNIITAQKQNTLLVPTAALVSQSQGTDPTVIAIGDGNAVQRTPVRIGLRNDRVVEIVSGLSDGQLVATSGLNDLSDGDIVAPQVETRTAYAR